MIFRRVEMAPLRKPSRLALAEESTPSALPIPKGGRGR